MKFQGDIIITDPCYIYKDDDRSRCDCGRDMKKLGIENSITRHTLYGDWACGIFDLDTGKRIGNFCADGAMVGVFLLDEVLKYNPDFDYHINRPWTTTWIKDFDGKVNFEVIHEEGIYEDDSEWHKKGDKWEDDFVRVIGTGNVNFVSGQTGF